MSSERMKSTFGFLAFSPAAAGWTPSVRPRINENNRARRVLMVLLQDAKQTHAKAPRRQGQARVLRALAHLRESMFGMRSGTARHDPASRDCRQASSHRRWPWRTVAGAGKLSVTEYCQSPSLG